MVIPKEDTGAPVINYSVAYDRNNAKPLYYEDYPGSIVDVSQLQYMLEKKQAVMATKMLVLFWIEDISVKKIYTTWTNTDMSLSL